MRHKAAFVVHATRAAFLVIPFACSAGDFNDGRTPEQLALPLPPAIDDLIGLPDTYKKGRAAHLALITREAEKAGLPAAVADAVAHVESRFNPTAIGGVGEVGLMQIRPQTAAMLGHKGLTTDLLDPETNVRFGVKYLAQAWQLAKGDLCRALMKYRAGHGEERMSPLSVEYCRRAREHLAAIGSSLANGARPPAIEASTSFAEDIPAVSSGRVRVISLGIGQLRATSSLSQAEAAFRTEVKVARAQARLRTRTNADSERFWTAHEARIRLIKARHRHSAPQIRQTPKGAKYEV